MLPIRKGDGTGLSVPGFAEVRKGDGTVLWSSGGGGVPDSELYPAQPREAEASQTAYDSVAPDPDVTNPVLDTSDVDDSADTVTDMFDPFMYVPDGDDAFSDWQMFFEINRDTYAVIGHATSPDQGLTWNYNQIAIDSGSHLSYPLVFRNGGDYYMMPNDGTNSYQPLYKATASDWPLNWTEIKQYLSGVSHGFKDHMLYRRNDRWWYIVGTGDGGNNSGIRVYYSDSGIDLIENVDSWTAHPENPVVSGRTSAARGGGRGIIENDGQIIAFYQDNVSDFGDKVRAYEITDLTTTTYADAELPESPVLEESGSGWNSTAMHQYDPWYVDSEGYWRAAVDGDDGSKFTIGIYRTGVGSTDSTVSQFDARELTASDGDVIGTFTNKVGSDATGSGTYRPSGVSGEASVELDGSSDGYEVDISQISQPYTVYAIINPGFDSTETAFRPVVANFGSSPGFGVDWNGSEWRLFAGNELQGTTNASDRRILSAYVDGTNSKLRENRTETASGDAGTNDMPVVEFGMNTEASRYFLGDIGLVEVHNGEPDAGFVGREDELANNWGLSV